MKLAVIGSRTFSDARLAYRVLDEMRPDAVISGGAAGADTIGAMWATSRGVELVVYDAKWDDLSHPDAIIRTGQYGKYDAKAGHRRNQQIIDDCDQVLAFWDGKSKGTADTISKAKAAGKPVRIVMF